MSGWSSPRGSDVTPEPRALSDTLSGSELPGARGPWLVEQTETDELFASWPVEPAGLAGRIPPPLSLDTFDGSAWITLVTFRMERLHLRGLPPLPGLRTFGEVNCLTHVRLGDERGVWFFRIEAGTRLGSVVGRVAYALPYHHAAVTVTAEGEWRSVRSEGRAADGRITPALRARYRPIGREEEARRGTLAHFILERFVMYSQPREGALRRAVQGRAPRPVRECEVVVERNTLPATVALPGPAGKLTAWFCGRSVVRTGLPGRVATATAR
jgi:uncharacterized protein YqjF (DUF2071 family)